jgi:hypothetical protein
VSRPKARLRGLHPGRRLPVLRHRPRDSSEGPRPGQGPVAGGCRHGRTRTSRRPPFAPTGGEGRDAPQTPASPLHDRPSPPPPRPPTEDRRRAPTQVDEAAWRAARRDHRPRDFTERRAAIVARWSWCCSPPRGCHAKPWRRARPRPPPPQRDRHRRAWGCLTRSWPGCGRRPRSPRAPRRVAALARGPLWCAPLARRAGRGRPGAALAGRVTLVNVWASWWAPCRAVCPSLGGGVRARAPVLPSTPPRPSRGCPRVAQRAAGAPSRRRRPDGAVTRALRLGRLPLSYVIRADGARPCRPAGPFTSPEEVAAAVGRLSDRDRGPGAHATTRHRQSGIVSTLDPEAAPPWLRTLLDGLLDVDRTDLLPHHLEVPPAGARRAAILMLFGETPAQGPDVLLAERQHLAFPRGPGRVPRWRHGVRRFRRSRHRVARGRGGDRPRPVRCRPARRPAGAVPAAVGLRGHAGARALGPSESRPRRRPRRNRHRCARPARGTRDPANRLRIQHPSSGYIGAAFIVSGLLVWGFTAGILSALLDRGGWARPWDTTRVLDLEEAWRTARADRQEIAGP